MTLKVYKSHTVGIDPAGFVSAVEAHRQALLAHRFTGDAAPTAHPLVEAAVVRVPCEGGPDDFVSDFEVVDDLPAPVDLRAALLARIHIAEGTAALAVIGNAALRLLSIDAREAALKPVADRTAADVAALDRMQDVARRRTAIDRHGAVLGALVEDLPADQLATFEFEAFPS